MQSFRLQAEGMKLYREGKYPQAIEVLQKVVNIHLNSFMAWYYLGAALSATLQAQLQSPGTPDMFYGVSAFDPVTYIGLASFLALVALAAAWIPAARAARIDPTTALRGD